MHFFAPCHLVCLLFMESRYKEMMDGIVVQNPNEITVGANVNWKQER